MKKIAIAVLSATLLTSSTLAAGTVVGKYNGGEVTSQEIMKELRPMLDSQPQSKGKKFSDLDKKLQESLVRGYISQKVLEKEADKLGLRSSKEFKQKMKIAEFQLLQQELIERHLDKTITDKMVNDEYQKITKELKGQKEVKISHILLDTEEKAKDVKKQLNKGGKFGILAKKYSKDPSAKSNGGELGYMMKGKLVPEFESKAFSMKRNEISDPVKTEFGWHIIKVLDSRMIKIPAKEQAESSIRDSLSRTIISEYFSKLTEKANIEVKL